MIASIHQVQFLPYLGFFHKVAQSDIYILMDDVQAIRQDFTNRNKIKSPHGEHMLKIPVKKKNILIKDIEISQHLNWVDEQLKSLHHCYGKAEFYNKYIKEIEEILRKKNWRTILELDLEFLKWLFKTLNIKAKIILSSDLNTSSQSTQRLIDLCKKVGANTYFSGPGGKNYMDLELCKKQDLKVIFQEFKHPVYPQRFGEFLPYMSIIDALFNCSEEAVKKMIRGEWKNE